MTTTRQQPSPSAQDLAAIELAERDAWADVYEAAPEAIRAGLGLASRRIDDGALLVCKAIDNIQFNRFAALGVAQPPRPESLDAAIAGFADAGVRNWIVQCPEANEELSALCVGRGLEPHARTWAKFLRGPDRIEAKTTLDIREIGTEDAAAFGAAAAAGFGLPPVVGQWLTSVAGRAGWRCFSAFEGRNAVAAGAVYCSGKAAWFGIGATLPSHRNRGAQSALLAARIEAAAAAGCTLLTTETGIPHAGEAGPSFKNIQAAGFRIVYRRPNYCRPG